MKQPCNIIPLPRRRYGGPDPRQSLAGARHREEAARMAMGGAVEIWSIRRRPLWRRLLSYIWR